MNLRRGRRMAVWIAVLIGQFALISGVAARATASTPSPGAYAMNMAPMSSMSAAHMSAMPMAGMVMAAGKGDSAIKLHQHVVRVSIHNFAFHPARLTVSPGTRIIWTNTDSDPHTVDSTKNIWSSDALDTGATFARQFKKTGSFTYYCSIHPFMHGVIIVKR